MNKKLSRPDIDGQKIRRVLQTPFRDIEGVTVCRLFVELDNEMQFELLSEEELEPEGIQQTHLHCDLIPAQFQKNAPNPIGATVETVVFSDLLSTIAVKLIGGHIICFKASGPNYVGPYILAIEPYFVGELFSYWDKQPCK
jgi:hypothetical protein